MKLLVFSDSHGNIHTMKKAIDANLKAGGIDRIFFLGDGIRDIHKLFLEYPKLKFDCVLGNNDYSGDVSLELGATREKLVTIGAWRFLLVHGDKQDVKSSDEGLVFRGAEMKADCVLFGHTHRACDITVDDPIAGKIRLINPGSASLFSRSFARIETVGGELVCGFGEM